LLKEQEARQYERDHYQREDHNIKMDLERERHAAEIDAVRKELREWEARREELGAQQHKDPESEEGIERIIALLKDQMLHQELALVNLKESEFLKTIVLEILRSLVKLTKIICIHSSHAEDKRYWTGV
jgi:hypothetical protein